jgi:ASPIC/UnbV protein/VCBS repeat protein
VGLLSGVALNAEGRAQAGMGVDAGDYDNDGWMDLVVTNFAHDTNTLYRNLGNGLFTDVTQQTGLAAPTFERMGWGTAFLDADLDGKLDLFFANGHIYPQVDESPSLKETFRQKSQLFLNDLGGASGAPPRPPARSAGVNPATLAPLAVTFRDVSATAGSGLQTARASRGLAVGDLDNDGDLDLVISNMDDVPTVLENRQHTGHHWVGFQLKKDGTNAFAIGARVTVDAGGRRQIREIHSGGSYLSQNDLRAHFGLGDYAGPLDVEVRLGADVWRWKGLAADRYASLPLREQDRVRPLSSLYLKRQHCVHDRRPTVHVQDLPGNEARFIHAQEHHGVADISRGAQTSHRGPATLVPGPNRVLDRLRQDTQDASLDHVGRAKDATRADAVDSDATWRQGHRKVPNERVQRRLGGPHGNPRLPTTRAAAGSV